MTYKTHKTVALLASSVLFIHVHKIELTVPMILLLAIITVLGSSVPDLDTPSGKVWSKIPAGSLIGRIINPIFIGGHRHLSHSILGFGIFIALFGLLIKLLPQYPMLSNLHSADLMLAFSAGYLSHIFADLFTEAGVPLLFPMGYHFGIPPDPFKRVRIKTGRWFENLVIYPAVNIALIVIIYDYLKNR